MARRTPAPRWIAGIVVLLLLAAACGGDDDPTLAVPADTTTSAPAAGAPGAAPTSAPPAGTGTEGGEAPAPSPSVAPEPNPPGASGWPVLDGTGPPGSFAADVLRADRSAVVEVEVLTQDGAEPRQGTLDHLAEVLRTVTGGKDVVVRGGPTPPVRDSWTAADVRAAAGAADQGGGRAVLRLLFVHGTFSEAEGVLGVSVQGDAAAVFSDEVDGAGSPLVGSAAIEDAVTVHELGHLLGLVDLHLDTGRDDPEHPGHSTNRRSVMYWAVESTLVADVLSGGPPRDFDDADLADLAAIRRG